MRDLIFDVTLDPDGRYVAEAQGEGIFTDAADWEELKRNVREVVSAFYFDSAKPAEVRLHLVRDEVLAVA